MKWLLFGLGGLAVYMAMNNWKVCSQQFYLVDQNGNQLMPPLVGVNSNPLCGANNKSFPCAVVTSISPSPSCLFNPFPGGI